MTYLEFKDSIQRELGSRPAGLTWKELKETLDLPYDRPCPEWTRRLEMEIGLARRPGNGPALVWEIRPSRGAASARKSRG
jgi:hypothetical protein